MKRTLPVLTLIMLMTIVFLARFAAATDVGGVLRTDTLWRLADSPFNVQSDVQLPSGVTLPIEPGVEVRFTGADEILVQGRMVADGTPASPISSGALMAF